MRYSRVPGLGAGEAPGFAGGMLRCSPLAGAPPRHAAAAGQPSLPFCALSFPHASPLGDSYLAGAKKGEKRSQQAILRV